jgi:NAD(P)-dependent dehydrogenase (short-subunit alcohol dehydrogenase family)
MLGCGGYDQQSTKLVKQTVQVFGRLDIMINNAGMETPTSVLESSERDFDLAIAVNLKGALAGVSVACTFGLIITVMICRHRTSIGHALQSGAHAGIRAHPAPSLA